MRWQRAISEGTFEKAGQKENAASASLRSSIPSQTHSAAFPQQRLGNRSVLSLLRAGPLQAKLEISQPDDPYEREADRLAEAVIRMPEPAVQRKCAPCASGGPPCRKCASEEPILLRRRTVNETEPSTAPPIVHGVLHSPGEPLDPATRTFFEPRFGHDFSKVRVHISAESAESARKVNALAYTAGRDVVFAKGQYSPSTVSGRRLIAHELSHVLQQGMQLAVCPELCRGDDDSTSKTEAEGVSGAVAQGGAYQEKIKNNSTPKLFRQQAPDRKQGGNTDLSGPPVLQETPVTFIAEPLDILPEAGMPVSGLAFSGGLSLHVLASGDMGWLSSSEAARRVMSPQYWSPLLPRRGIITLDRLLDELPRDLAPKIESELASGQPLSWVRGVGATGEAFTEAELRSIPSLVRRFNGGEVLTEIEISLLARATEIHVGAPTPGAPVVSYTEPNFELSFAKDRRYRVRVEIPQRNVLNVTEANAITNQWKQSPNVNEMEFMAVANHEGRIVSVQRMTGIARPSVLMRYSGAIRWGGRIMLIAGLGTSAYRIATAPEGKRLNVAAEEGGSLAGGALGTPLAVAGCLGSSVLTGGFALFVCGLLGGALGAWAGSGVAGTMAQGLQAGGTPCPSCHALQREFEARRSASALRSVDLNLARPGSGEQLSEGGRAPDTRAMTPQELELIRRWIQSQR